EIEDNGIGFTKKHRDSFDTLYTDEKIQQGGKGFGRITCLKYFVGLDVESRYLDGETVMLRTFSMGNGTDIIVSEKVEESKLGLPRSRAKFLILTKSSRTFEKKSTTIARNPSDRLFPYFISWHYSC